MLQRRPSGGKGEASRKWRSPLNYASGRSKGSVVVTTARTLTTTTNSTSEKCGRTLPETDEVGSVSVWTLVRACVYSATPLHTQKVRVIIILIVLY